MAITLSNRRATAAGIKYSTSDNEIVTVNGQSSTCTCGLENYCVVCSHRRMALAQEKRYEQEARERAEYCEQFSIYA